MALQRLVTAPTPNSDRMKPNAIESLTPFAMHFSFPRTSPDLISSFSAYVCTKFVLDRDREGCPTPLLTKSFLSLWPLGTEAVVPCLWPLVLQPGFTDRPQGFVCGTGSWVSLDDTEARMGSQPIMGRAGRSPSLALRRDEGEGVCFPY